MAHLFPCPKSDLKAVYNSKIQLLTITAEGEKLPVIIGPWFKKDEHFVGGLSFSLLCYWGGLPGGKPTYKTTYEMSIQLPNPVMPSNTVIINTANGPYPINIEFDPTNPQSAELSRVGEPAIPQTPGSVLAPITIITREGSQFPISAQASLGNLSGVNMDFTPHHLKLTDAKIAGKDIVWTFEAVTLGHTIVDVVSTIVPENGGMSFIKIQRYLVEVIAYENQETK